MIKFGGDFLEEVAFDVARGWMDGLMEFKAVEGFE